MSNSEISIKLQAIYSQQDEAQKAIRDIKRIREEASQTGKSLSLGDVMGVNGRQAGYLVDQFSRLAGVTGPAASGLMAVVSGLGPVGLLTTAATGGVIFLKGQIDEANKSLGEEKEALSQTSKNLNEYTTRSKEAAAVSWVERQVPAQTAFLKGFAQAVGWVNDTLLHNASISQMLSSAKQQSVADAKSLELAEFKVGQVVREQAQSKLEAMKADGMWKHGIEEVAQALTPLQTFDGKLKAWKDLTVEEKAAMYDLAKALGAVGDAQRDVNKAIDMGEAHRQAWLTGIEKGYNETLTKQINDSKAAHDRIDAIVQQSADRQKEIWAQAAASTSAKLQGMAAGMLQVSKVTPEDERRRQLQQKIASGSLEGDDLKKAKEEMNALGPYKEQNDENLRRMRSIAISPTLDNENVKRLPLELQAELKAAFAAGGSEALKIKASDLVARGESFSDPRMWDVKKMANDLKAAVQMEKDKAKMTDLIVKESGLDPNDPAVQKALGVDVAPQLAQVKQQAEAEIKKLKPGAALYESVQNDIEAIKNAGQASGQIFINGMLVTITSGENGFIAKFAKALVPALNDYFMPVGFVQ